MMGGGVAEGDIEGNFVPLSVGAMVVGKYVGKF
jgi:hypothetical protein